MRSFGSKLPPRVTGHWSVMERRIPSSLGLAIKGNRSRLSPSTTGASIEEQIKKVSEGDGGDIITFGCPTLVQSLTNAELVDEYRMLIHRLS